jgi:prepilin-type N-terminal cleavage/methylation domain-containing protein
MEMTAEMKTPQKQDQGSTKVKRQGEQGFTLLEVVIALVIMLIVTLGAAALFAYSINYNSGAYDRTLAHAVAQKQMEYLSRSSFTDLVTPAQPEPTITSAGRKYTVVTTVCSTSGCGGSSTLKKITLRVTPQGAGANWVRSSVVIETLRAARATGPYYQ